MTGTLPAFDELPRYKDMAGCAWGVWGKDDQLGTVNILTEEVVKRAATEEIRTGKTCSLNWPINFPDGPSFKRKAPAITTKTLGSPVVRDDEIHVNTQSGSQWDGMKHFGIIKEQVYYSGIKGEDIPEGSFPMPDPHNIDPKLKLLGIQHWAEHGICGRGVLLDMVRFYTEGGRSLPYDPWTAHPVPLADIEACARKQGVEFRTGDILLLRMGYMQKWNTSKPEALAALAEKDDTFAGIEQSEDMKRFLWNNHFAAVASDQPSLERWPAPEGTIHLHQTILGLWGMPLGELFDLERVSDECAKAGRWTFFFSSWPMNIIGGVAGAPNAAAYF
ncbi:hypothetical protein BD626DRAFT_225283 [Schizophyllum amplum]|uniref:Cyclase-domain-containing protein n=1 Tax=Schizophyllum amplum TaxID=97359 RepID=A0A550BX96_9AGAR|nr:hypothetical protein BD626DRAFT_225283 [Auriculariopsis ampla]